MNISDSFYVNSFLKNKDLKQFSSVRVAFKKQIKSNSHGNASQAKSSSLFLPWIIVGWHSLSGPHQAFHNGVSWLDNPTAASRMVRRHVDLIQEILGVLFATLLKVEPSAPG